MTTAASAPVLPTGSAPRPVAGWRLLLDHLGHAVVDLWRQKVVTLFTVVVPLVWLVVVGFIAGNEVLDEGGVRVMQFITPTAAAMGVLYASFPTVAISLAEARHSGVLRRIRSTPLPLGTYLAARIGAAVVFAVGSVLIMMTVGVLVYDVRVVGSTAVATVVTVLAALVCFAAVGTAVAAWSRTLALAQAASIGSAVALTFVSGMFTLGGTMPGWLDRLGDLLPLKPVAAALQDQMNPYHPAVGWDVEGVAVLVVWTAVAVVLAVRGLKREPGGRSGVGAPSPAVPAGGAGPASRRGRSAPAARDEDASSVVARTPPGGELGRSVPAVPSLPAGPVADVPSAGRLLRDQVVAGARATWRDPGSLFFAVVLPVGLYAFMLTLQGGGGAMPDGTPVAAFFAASMVTWGTAVAAFTNLPETVATARDAGVLQRLRATPLRRWQLLVGRGATAVGTGLVVTAGVLALGSAAYDVRVTAAGVLLGGLVVVLGAAALGACGFALAAAVPSAKAFGAVALVVLLPLAFFSEVFVVGGPAWMGRVGDVFPLKHLQNALALAWAPQPSVGWAHVAVLLAWGLVAGLVAVRWFRWDARRR